MVEYPTLARKAVARQLEREMMAEELRLLYVAMTRAREKLIMSITMTNGVRMLEKLGDDLNVPISPMALERQLSVGHWVLLHALTRPEGEGLRALAALPEMVNEHVGPQWDMYLVDGSEFLQQPGRFVRFLNRDTQEPAQEALENMVKGFTWIYPGAAATQIPSKLTATQIKGRILDQEAREDAAVPEMDARFDLECVPDFVTQEKGLTPAQRGTALHLAMQYLPLKGMDTPEKVEQELERLEREGFLTPLQRQAARPEQLAAFFASELGREMARAEQCRREFKFMVLVDARKYYPQAPEGERVLLQGVIDAWFISGETITILDFKSDRVTLQSQKTRAEEYRAQLEAYSTALEQITGKRVGRRILWFFATGSAIEL